MTSGSMFEQLALRVSLEDRIALLESALENRDAKVRKLKQRVKDLEAKLAKSHEVNAQLVREIELERSAKPKKIQKRAVKSRSIYVDSDEEEDLSAEFAFTYDLRDKTYGYNDEKEIKNFEKPERLENGGVGYYEDMRSVYGLDVERKAGVSPQRAVKRTLTERAAKEEEILAGILTRMGVEVDHPDRIRQARRAVKAHHHARPHNEPSLLRRISEEDLVRVHEEFYRRHADVQDLYSRRSRIRGARYSSVGGSSLRDAVDEHARLRKKSNSMQIQMGKMIYDAYTNAKQEEMERYMADRW